MRQAAHARYVTLLSAAGVNEVSGGYLEGAGALVNCSFNL